MDNFFKRDLLTLVLKTLLAKPANHVSPVLEEVMEAAAEELEEPWEERLRTFTHDQMEPTAKPSLANTAAEVRDAFFKAAGGAVQSRDVGLKPSRRDFTRPRRRLKVVSKSQRSEFTNMLSATTVSASYSCEVVMHEG